MNVKNLTHFQLPFLKISKVFLLLKYSFIQ